MQDKVQFTIANPEVKPSEEVLDMLAEFIADLALRRARERLSLESQQEAA